MARVMVVILAVAGASGLACSGGSTGRADAEIGGAAGASGELMACAGAEPIPATQTRCRVAKDCPIPGWTCSPNYVTGGCGACFPAQHECAADTDCGADRVCVTEPLATCICNGPGTKCAARCTAGGCAADETCDLAGGHCKPSRCEAGFSCPTDRTCAPTRAGADAHGCAIARCADDGYHCLAGWVCATGAGTDPHGCSSVSCAGGGFTCPPNTDCNAASTSPNHCEWRTCTSDGQCDCGACIQGECQQRFFVCSPPPPA